MRKYVMSCTSRLLTPDDLCISPGANSIFVPWLSQSDKSQFSKSASLHFDEG